MTDKRRVTASDLYVIELDMQSTSTLFKTTFLEEIQTAKSFDESELDRLAHSFQDDLADTSRGHYSLADWQTITVSAALKFARIFKNSEKSFQEAWIQTVREFHTTDSRPYHFEQKKPKPLKVKASTDGLGLYLWAIFQAMVITKVFILYFGAKVAEDPTDTASKIYLCLAIFYTFLSPAYIGWKIHKRKAKEDSNHSTL